MARYTGSVCRLCRREGCKLFLKGEKCYGEKCTLNNRAEAANGTGISCHLFVPPITLFCAWADGIRCAGWASRP